MSLHLPHPQKDGPTSPSKLPRIIFTNNDKTTSHEPISVPLLQAVHSFIQQHGRPPVVLDIGCGTGLLSMLAARAGAEEVYGCEMYEPLAQIAREVSELNCKGKITVRVYVFAVGLGFRVQMLSTH